MAVPKGATQRGKGQGSGAPEGFTLRWERAGHTCFVTSENKNDRATPVPLVPNLSVLPRGSQSEHTSQNSSPLMSSPRDSAAWTSCPVLGSWAVWTRGGRIVQAWLG